MDPLTQAAISAALAAIFGGGGAASQDQAAPAPAGSEGAVGAGFQLPTPGTDIGIAPVAPDTSFLDPLAEQLSSLATAPVTVPLPSQVPGAGASTPVPGPIEAPVTPELAATPSSSIGEILMASPEALKAVAALLGLGQSGDRTVRPAPTAGGSTGSVIPGLALPQSGQIGAILRQIPGLG